jgi:antitoxin VapB
VVYILDIYQQEGKIPMKTAKLFQNGRSQAVRLPKEFRIPGKEVYIKREGEAIVLLPKEKSWEPLFESLNHFAKDFKMERNQPGENQKREPMFK